MGLLDDKVAIITGAGSGIGKATALAFAREGAHVVVNDTGGSREGTLSDESVAEAVAHLIKSDGGSASAHTQSIATKAGADSLVQQALDAYGKVDILINNAGILRDKTLLKMDEDMFDSVIAVHLKGTFLCTKACAAQMVKQNSGGRIVNTASVSGMLGNFGQANYAAAKAGVYGLTRTASIELQRYGITVNAIAPLAKTRMTADLPMFEKMSETMSTDHVSAAHLFFASELCGQRTGFVLSVAGGKLSLFKVVETAGCFKEVDNGVWTPQEILESWAAISKP